MLRCLPCYIPRDEIRFGPASVSKIPLYRCARSGILAALLPDGSQNLVEIERVAVGCRCVHSLPEEGLHERGCMLASSKETDRGFQDSGGCAERGVRQELSPDDAIDVIGD